MNEMQSTAEGEPSLDSRVFLKLGKRRELFETARGRMKWTKAQMAEYIGISDTALFTYEIEGPRRHPTWRVIKRTLTLVPELKDEILASVEDLKPSNWGSKKGISIVNKRYAQKLADWGRKGGEKAIRLLWERYPDKLQGWRRAAGRKAAQVTLTKYRDKLPEWGRKGIAVGIKKYPDKVREWAKEGAKALAEKYRDKLSEWGKKGAATLNTRYKDGVMEGAKLGCRKGALRGAECQGPTEQMKLLIKENEQMGLVKGVDFKVNYTIKKSERL